MPGRATIRARAQLGRGILFSRCARQDSARLTHLAPSRIPRLLYTHARVRGSQAADDEGARQTGRHSPPWRACDAGARVRRTRASVHSMRRSCDDGGCAGPTHGHAGTGDGCEQGVRGWRHAAAVSPGTRVMHPATYCRCARSGLTRQEAEGEGRSADDGHRSQEHRDVAFELGPCHQDVPLGRKHAPRRGKRTANDHLV